MTEDFFEAFQAESAAAWKQRIQMELKGGDYQKLLNWTSPEGILVKPFYSQQDLKPAEGTYAASENWKIGQQFFWPLASHQELNQLHDSGIDIPWFRWDKQEDLNALMTGTQNLENTFLLGPGNLEEESKGPFLDYLKQMNDRASSIYDPIGQLAETGNWSLNQEADLSFVLSLHAMAEKTQLRSFLGVDGSLYQEAGANRVQELAYCLAQAHEYLRFLNNSGRTLNHPMTFMLSVGSNYFFEIAKIRALRNLWASLAEAYEANTEAYIIARPSHRMMTLYDYNTNMLRTTTACMSAILGTADLICNEAYDVVYHLPNEFGDRIARNQLLLLKEESYFTAVGNAADGSYYIESITRELGTKAMALFKTLEKGGGFLSQLKAHKIQPKIKESARKEQEDFDRGNKILIGTNRHPNPEDRMRGQLEKKIFDIRRGGKTLLEPVLRKRLARELERKRWENEAS